MAPHRILFVNHVARLGGAERSLLDLVRRLDRQRFVPVAVIPGPGELADGLLVGDVPCHYLPLRRLRKTVNPFQLPGIAANVIGVARDLTALIRAERISLVHTNSNTAQLYAGPAARRAGVPCLWHTRDLVALGPLGRWMDRHATRTLAISECVRRNVARYTRDPAKLRTVYSRIAVPSSPHALDPMGRARASGPAVTVMQQELLGHGAARTPSPYHEYDASTEPPFAPVIGMIGQLVPWKGQRVFIEVAALVAAQIPAARFVIVGGDLFDEHRAYCAELQSRAAELGLASRLTFTGHRPDAAALLSGLDVLVHPVEREPLGRVVLEAMAAAKPVVAVNACGPGEIIRDRVDGLLTATAAPAELAAAVVSLLHDPELAARLGAAARQRVARDFDIGETVRQIEAIYDEVLAAGGTPCA